MALPGGVGALASALAAFGFAAMAIKNLPDASRPTTETLYGRSLYGGPLATHRLEAAIRGGVTPDALPSQNVLDAAAVLLERDPRDAASRLLMVQAELAGGRYAEGFARLAPLFQTDPVLGRRYLESLATAFSDPEFMTAMRPFFGEPADSAPGGAVVGNTAPGNTALGAAMGEQVLLMLAGEAPELLAEEEALLARFPRVRRVAVGTLVRQGDRKAAWRMFCRTAPVSCAPGTLDPGFRALDQNGYFGWRSDRSGAVGSEVSGSGMSGSGTVGAGISARGGDGGGVELLVGGREARRFALQIFPLPRPASLRVEAVSVPDGVEVELDVRCASGSVLTAPLPITSRVEAATVPIAFTERADCDFGLVSLRARKTRATGGSAIVEIGALAIVSPTAAPGAP